MSRKSRRVATGRTERGSRKDTFLITDIFAFSFGATKNQKKNIKIKTNKKK